MNFRNLLVILLMIPASVLFAQNGKMTGKVTDGSSVMIGVAVVVNDSLVAATDLEGRYTFSNLKPGTYTVKASMLGYETTIIKSVRITAGNVSTVNILMKEAGGIELEAAVIEWELKDIARTNENLLAIEVKNLDVIGSAIGSQTVGKTPDRVVSDVMKRMSGASVQENKFVIIRGLSDRYNTALINGMPLPSTEPDRKAFSFDIFPAVMLDNMLIYKTAAPHLPGDFAGGVIQLVTRDIPDSSMLSLGAGLSYNSQSTFNKYLTYQGGDRDWLGVDDGTRQLTDTMPGKYAMKHFLQNPYTRYRYSKIFTNDWAIDSIASSPLGQSYQAAFASRFRMFRNPMGVVGALTYNYNRKMQKIYRSDYDVEAFQLFEYIDDQYKENVQWGAMMNFAYKIDSVRKKGELRPVSFVRSKFTWKNMLSVTGEDMVVERNGTDFQTERYVLASAMQYTSSVLLSSQLTGDHAIGKRDKAEKIKVNWGAGYSRITRDLPDLRRMVYGKNLIPQEVASDTLWEAYVPFGAPSPNYAGKFWSYLTENLYSGTADVLVPFKLGRNNSKQKNVFRAGVATQIKEREFDARVLGYSVANFMKFDYDLLYLPQGEIFSPENIGRDEGFKLGEATAPSDEYLAGSDLYAGYAMFDQTFTFGKKDPAAIDEGIAPKERALKAVYGIRVESFNQRLDAVNYSGDTIMVDTTYLDVLPSVNLTFALTERMNVRLAGSRTVARPEFREIAPFSFYDFNTSTAVVGNDTLIRTNITNFDAKYEFYPGAGQLFAVTAFYKDFKNPIESVAFYGGSGSRTRSYQNAKTAVNYGAELEMRFKLNMFDSIGLNWKQWDFFTAFANLSYIRSSVDLSGIKFSNTNALERPLQGQSPYLINCGMIYFNDTTGTGVSVMFNRIGRRIADVGSDGYLDIYEAPRSIVDFQVSQRFLRNGEIKVNFSDVLNREAVFYQDEDGSGKYEEDKDHRITGMRYGYNVSFSINYKF